MLILRAEKTGRGKGTHSHLAVADENIKGGITSINKDHQHEVKLNAGAQGMQDPVSGIVVEEAIEPFWECMPAGKDGHTHEMSEYQIKQFEDDKDDDEILKECRELYKTARSEESDSRKDAEESEKFYSGEQWDKKDKDKLKAEDRAALVINEIESKIDMLSGYQRQNRSDFKFLPTEEGDGKVADILNIIVKNIVDQNDYEYAETDIFEDGCITGRGNVHCYIDYSGDPQGNIKIEHFNWKDVSYGPHNKKCAEDAEYVSKSKWYSMERIESMWPEKAEEIENSWEEIEENTVVSGGSGSADRYTKSDNWWGEDLSSFVDIAKKDFRVIEIERKEFYRMPVLVDIQSGTAMPLGNMSTTDVGYLESIQGMGVVYQDITRIRVITFAGNVLLNDVYSDDDIDFSVIPFYAKKRDKKFWGKVFSVKDAQSEINKRHSQSVDILNKVASYGWFYDVNTFSSPTEAKAFKEQASKPGFVLQVADVQRIPVQVAGTKFPQEIAEMMKYDSQKIREIMNINLEMLGQARASQSGVAIVEQKRQGLVGNEYLFDNLNQMKKRLGRKIVRFIQKVYTPQRMLRILQSQAQATDAQIGGQPIADYDPNVLLSILTNADLMKYDLVVSESSFNPTTRMANFLIWSDLAGKGAPVPLQTLVDMSDLPDKEKVKQAIAQEMQQKQDAEKMKYDMEIKKTIIAKDKTGQMGGTQ